MRSVALIAASCDADPVLRFIMVLAIVWGSAGAATADEPDPEAARGLAAKGREALRENEPQVAAGWFEAAARVAPNPLWELAAGDAWLVSAEPAAAVAHLEAAIAAGLDKEVVADAQKRLALAKLLVGIVARSRELTKRKDYARAMSAWEEAFGVLPLGRFAILAARAADDGGRVMDVLRLARVAEASPDLSREERRWVASALARVTAPVVVPPAREASPASAVAPWVLVGTGGALVLGGVAALLFGDAAWSDVHEMKAGASDGVVFATTRAAAEQRADLARTWTAVGWVGIAVGAVAAGLGVGWLAAEVPARTPGGVVVSMRGGF